MKWTTFIFDFLLLVWLFFNAWFLFLFFFPLIPAELKCFKRLLDLFISFSSTSACLFFLKPSYPSLRYVTGLYLPSMDKNLSVCMGEIERKTEKQNVRWDSINVKILLKFKISIPLKEMILNPNGIITCKLTLQNFPPIHYVI